MVLPDDYADPPPKIWLRWLLGIMAALLVIGVGVMYVTDAWHPAFYLNREQRDIQAVYTMYETLVMFVMTNGHWPYDEKDLRANVKYAGGRYAGAYYKWPADASRLLKLVHVDYNLPLSKIAEADAKKFPYVHSKMRGPDTQWVEFATRLIGAANARIQGEMAEEKVLAHPTPKAPETKEAAPKAAETKAPEAKGSDSKPADGVKKPEAKK